MKEFHLYTAPYRENAQNANYPKAAKVASFEDLQAAAKYDHIMSEMKDGHRSEDNFLGCDCIILDLDNTLSHDPDSWKTLDDIQDALPDVQFYAVQSRNYMREKRKGDEVQEAREKYHLYFPLSKRIENYADAKYIMYLTVGLFPYFDMAAAKPAQFLFGVADPKGKTIEGDYTLDEYLAMLDEAAEIKAKEALWDLEAAVSTGELVITNEARKAFNMLREFLGLEQIQQAEDEQDEAPLQQEWIEEADQAKAVKWFLAWAKAHGQQILDRYQINTKKHPKTIVYCVRCPWEADHTMEGAKNEAVVMVDRDGKLQFLCRHSSHIGLGWRDYRAKIEEAERKEAAEKQEDEARQNYLQTSALAALPQFMDGISASADTPVIQTNYRNLDAVLEGGLYAGLYILGAISSLGKTTFILQMADQLAQLDNDVIIFSLEMSKEELIAKSISRTTYKMAERLQDAKTVRGILTGSRWKDYSQRERELIANAVGHYSKYASHIYIHEGMGDIGVQQIRDTVQRHIEVTGKTPIVIIDYIQILAPTDVRLTDKQATDKNVLELKRLSRDYKTPVLGISSFNRDSYKDQFKKTSNKGRVSMTDFKESGSLEYSADVLMGMEFQTAGTDQYDEAIAKSENPRKIRLVIIKNRNGRAWEKVDYSYYPMFNHFEED